jgi:excisionase family DNA binding protein
VRNKQKMPNHEKNRLILSVEEVSRLLGLSRGLTYEAIRTGQIPSIRIGRRILIPRTRLYQLLDNAHICADKGLIGTPAREGDKDVSF